MVDVTIKEKACRGCRICTDICPTDVLEYVALDKKVVVKNTQNCIACLSCTYSCPSMAIVQANYHSVKNYYRDLSFSVRAKRFL